MSDIENKQIQNINSNYNAPFMNITYPKIMSYVPHEIGEGKYSISITDIRVQQISQLELKLRLPEIKGEGTISYLKNYIFHIIENFNIYIYNQYSEDKILLDKLDKEDIYNNALYENLIQDFLNKNGGEQDEFCYEKSGSYDDDIIFKERNITIPIYTNLSPIKIFPGTKIVFEFKINSIDKFVTYNTIYKEKSLKQLMTNFRNNNLNIKLEFSNIIFNISEENEKNHYQLFIKKNKVIGPNNTQNLNSSEFKNTSGIIFSNKTDIFNKTNRFLINPGPNNTFENIRKKFLKKILECLVIVSEQDLSKAQEKIALGYKKESKFEVVVDNKIYFDKNNHNYCQIYISNVPEGSNVYYHKNILTFSRRLDKNNILNISSLFKYIKGIYFEEEEKITFNLDEIEDTIDIWHMSIPVEIWDHKNNTETGDLRSIENKTKDFYISNDFIYGMDFLSKDKGYKDVKISAGQDTLNNYYLDTFGIYRDVILKPIKMDKNNYAQHALFTTYNNIYNIKANPDINFNNFLANISWEEYPDYNPKNLYSRYPILTTIHFMKIDFLMDEKILVISEI